MANICCAQIGTSSFLADISWSCNGLSGGQNWVTNLCCNSWTLGCTVHNYDKPADEVGITPTDYAYSSVHLQVSTQVDRNDIHFHAEYDDQHGKKEQQISEIVFWFHRRDSREYHFYKHGSDAENNISVINETHHTNKALSSSIRPTQTHLTSYYQVYHSYRDSALFTTLNTTLQSDQHHSVDGSFEKSCKLCDVTWGGRV